MVVLVERGRVLVDSDTINVSEYDCRMERELEREMFNTWLPSDLLLTTVVYSEILLVV